MVRMGLAGSLSNMICEIMFHYADTVNVKAKTHHRPISSYGMALTIFKNEGLYGLSKGISACYYGSIACGLVYFTMYKLLKERLHEALDGKVNEGFVFFIASFVSEFLTLSVMYPYDTIKTRL